MLKFAAKILNQKQRETWHPIPFEQGKVYRATTTIRSACDQIEEGTELTYLSSGHSVYFGHIEFLFGDSEGKDQRWEIDEDSDPIKSAKGLFIELPEKANQGGDRQAASHSEGDPQACAKSQPEPERRFR